MKQFLCLLVLALPLCGEVKLTKHGSNQISVTIDGKPFTDFFLGPDPPKPYLWPLRAASGTIVTRGYPIDANVPGETHDHPHQRGLWFTHGDVNGYDFWANEASQNSPRKGKVLLKKLGKVAGGSKSGTIEAWFEWVAADTPLLEEHRTMTFYDNPTLRIMDFDLDMKALQKVKFGDTKEGTFAIRIAAGLEEPQKRSPASPKRTGKMTSAEGKEGEANIWGKPSPWVDYAGELEGEKLGIAIFDHPKNPRHPTHWHSRSYGLFAANIFGEHDFYNDKTRDGSMTLEPGQPLRFRYRVVIHPGDSQSAHIAELYKDYAGGK